MKENLIETSEFEILLKFEEKTKDYFNDFNEYFELLPKAYLEKSKIINEIKSKLTPEEYEQFLIVIKYLCAHHWSAAEKQNR